LINGSSKIIKVEIKDGPKLDKNRSGPQFGPDQRVQRGGHLEGMKRDRTAYL
jgi:hypothetical protein